MAKKGTTKKNNTTIETDAVETVVNDIIEEALPVEVVELQEKMEEIKPNEDFINQVVENPETAEEVLTEKLGELNQLMERVEEVAKEVSVKTKKNPQFTYMWNGMNLY
jgi:ABC-type hemin transport system substrate-binding protein